MVWERYGKWQPTKGQLAGDNPGTNVIYQDVEFTLTVGKAHSNRIVRFSYETKHPKIDDYHELQDHTLGDLFHTFDLQSKSLKISLMVSD